jgi:hypothetical protein
MKEKTFSLRFFLNFVRLIIATSDTNKPFLRDALPVLLRALKERGATNKPMTINIVKIFLQLSFEAECKLYLTEHAQEICGLLQKIVVAPAYSQDTLMSSQLLQTTIKPPSTSVASRLGLGFFKKNNGDSKSIIAAPRRGSSFKDQRHVSF